MGKEETTISQDRSTQKKSDVQSLEGMVFGRLTVISVLKSQSNGTKCLCRCSCGQEKEVFLSNLKSGRTKSCGCLNRTREYASRDITGQRFGSLTAIAPTDERQYRSVVWLCRCDCGREVKVSLKNLESGRKHSCGCKKKKKGTAAMDLAGRRFGKLTVVSMTDQRSYKGSVIWNCRCDCGNTVLVSADCLVNGNQRSCGCLRNDCMLKAREKLHFVDGTCVEWLKDRKDRQDNTSGHKGISIRKNGRYLAKIGFQNRQYYLGTYDRLEDALAVRRQAETMLFDNFLQEYRKWEEHGGEESFHFDGEALKLSLSDMRNAER